jgi:hypothetical protein
MTPTKASRKEPHIMPRGPRPELDMELRSTHWDGGRVHRIHYIGPYQRKKAERTAERGSVHMPWSGVLEEETDLTESIRTPIRSFYRLQCVETVYRRLFRQADIEIISGNNVQVPNVLKINQNRTSYPGVLRHTRYTCSVDLFYLQYI